VIYLLDTNAVIAVLRGTPPSVRVRLQRVAARANTVAVSSIVLFELWYGVACSERRTENAERLRIFLSGSIRVVPFDEDDAATADELRASLERAGKPVGPYDLLIAAQALRLGATLITSNVAEFERIRGLKWLSWRAKA